MEFALKTNELKSDFDSYLETVFKEIKVPSEILEAIEYSLFSGGKRLRPVIALYMAREFDISDEISLPLCAAIEMIHTYSLIHDDLPAMDNDDLRRGKPTSHVKFGEDIAILAGDGLLNLAFELILKNVPQKNADGYVKAASYIASSAGIGGMIGGQVMDIKQSADTIELLEEMHSLKTGKLFSACIMSMVYIARLTAKVQETYFEFSQKIGLLFQITDDILDVTGKTEMLGKAVGKDESFGKVTYVTKYGLEKSQEIADRTLQSCCDLLKRTGREHEFFIELVKNIRKREK